MAGTSPTLEGYRAAFRHPSLTFAEIAWRWTIGAVAWALFIFSFIEYLDTLPVTRGDATLLGTRQPLLIEKAISHILRGSLNRALFTVLLAALALAVLWIITASLGRSATVRALLDYFRTKIAGNVYAESSNAIRRPALRSLLAFNFLRVAVGLASLLAFAGAVILASFASPDKNPQPGIAFIFFLLLAGSICVVWPALNWLLSLASVFAIRDSKDTLDALYTAVAFSREHAGPVFAVSIWSALAHLAAIGVGGTAVLLPLAFVHVAPPRLIVAVIVLLMLVYFAVVDWLYIARLAGYICIAEMPVASVLSAPLPLPEKRQPPGQTAIDRDEWILSDLPGET